MSKLFDELAALKTAYEKKLDEAGEDAVKEVFKEFFEKHPLADSITWTQYTPYFNDGDACYFSVHEFQLTLAAPVDEDEEEEEDDDLEDGPNEEDEENFDDDDDYDDEDEHNAYALSLSDDSVIKAMGDDLGDLEEVLSQDVLEKVFGDHVRVTATAEGFDVVEYSHD